MAYTIREIVSWIYDTFAMYVVMHALTSHRDWSGRCGERRTASVDVMQIRQFYGCAPKSSEVPVYVLNRCKYTT